MKSPFNFIVKPYNGRRYDNIKNIGGIDFVTSVSQEDHTVSNRLAVVVSTPVNYTGEISEGDILLVHHNVFKYYYDMKGRQKSGRSFLMDDLFLVDDYQYFMYKKDGEWKSKKDYCFVRPIKKKDFYIKSQDVFQPLMGELVYGNDVLSSYGVNKGDIVSFKPDSEYEFNVDGETLYRVLTNRITWTQRK